VKKSTGTADGNQAEAPRLGACRPPPIETPRPILYRARGVEVQPSFARKVSEVDWQRWEPTEKATLLFVIRGGRILLIDKKTGLGAGKINGPGGRIEPGEAPMDAAVREVEEELCVTPTGVRWCGELLFQFTDGYSMRGFVYTASDFTGEPRETGEAAPLWTPVDEIPYDRMWEDDRLWVPLMLAGKTFRGFFIFSGYSLLDARVEEGYT
jgi:8-oxo-dGTP diphosphatase